jgi:hypothetical protein
LALPYEEYTLEFIERGRCLPPGDIERIRTIKAARR